MTVRIRVFILAIACLCLSGLAVAQSPDDGPMTRVPVDKSAPPPKDNRKAPPRSDTLAPDESSSKQTEIDVTPPRATPRRPPDADNSELGEFHPLDPHKAAKCIEVGDYYFKEGNYRGAISRYQEALDWKPRDADATYKLGESQEKNGDYNGRAVNYQALHQDPPQGTVRRQGATGNRPSEVKGRRHYRRGSQPELRSDSCKRRASGGVKRHFLDLAGFSRRLCIPSHRSLHKLSPARPLLYGEGCS